MLKLPSSQLKRIEASLAMLPEGTILELVMGDYTGGQNIGDYRFRGVLSKGVWTILTTYPPLRHDMLQEAISFSGQIDNGYIPAHDSNEVDQFMACWRQNSDSWYEMIHPTITANKITLEIKDEGELWNAARYVFNALRWILVRPE